MPGIMRAGLEEKCLTRKRGIIFHSPAFFKNKTFISIFYAYFYKFPFVFVFFFVVVVVFLKSIFRLKFRFETAFTVARKIFLEKWSP